MNSLRLYGLLGHPLTHSFSSKYFTKKFKENHLNCVYKNFDFSKIPTLTTLIDKNPNLRGLNITVPYKIEIINQLDFIDDNANEIGAVNAVKLKEGHSAGYNTDYLAFMEEISILIQPKNTRALILGDGGASRAVKYGLQKLNIPYSIVSRTKEKTEFVFEDINEGVLNNHNLIINTTPLGTYPNVKGLPDIPYELLKTEHMLFDLTYNPEITEFMKKGLSKGCKVKNGWGMLIRQAELSWDIWNQ